MYTYVASQCLSRSIGSQWSHPDLLDAALSSVYSFYSQAYLTLFHPILDRQVFVDLNDLRTEFSSYTGTVEQWLVSLGDRALPEVDSIPDGEVKFVKYSTARWSGYQIERAAMGFNHGVNYPQELLPDAVLTRNGYTTSLSLLHTHCLLTVGGYLLATDTDGEKAYIPGAARVLDHGAGEHVGIISFLDVGALTKVRLDKANIARMEEDTPMAEKAVFSVDESLEGKSCLLVLGGYLVLPQEGVFWQYGDKSLAISLNRLPLMERYFESREALDFTDLGIPPSNVNPEAFTVTDFWNDTTMENLLASKYTFLVIVDKPNLVINPIGVRTSAVPGHYTTVQDPVYPLVVGYGKIAEYWKEEEAGGWSLNVLDNFYRNFIISQQRPGYNGTATDHQVSSHPQYFSRGCFLEIAGYSAL